MAELTKEWLLTTIAELEEERDATPGAVNEDAANALAAMKRALASLDTEAVGYIDAEYAELLKSGHIESCSVYAESGEGCFPVYTAPLAPVSVPDALPENDDEEGNDIDYMEPSEVYAFGRTAGWNACRAAMLQGAERVTTAYKLPEGWVAVPVDPTEEMIAAAMCSNDVLFDKEDDTLFRVQHGEIWRAMLAAAPQQEV